jgi:integrase
MPSLKTELTEANVLTLKAPPGVSDFYVYDTKRPGLSLRLQGASRRYYTYYRTGDNKQRRMKIGTVGKITLATAWEQCQIIHARVTLGGDPQAAKEAERRIIANTFKDARASYLAKKRGELARGEFRSKSMANLEHDLSGLAAPLDRRRVVEITRREISALVDKVASERGPYAGRNLKMSLSGLFRYCIGTLGIIDNNPTIDVAVAAAPKRKHTLTDTELVAVYKACEDPALGEFNVIMRLLLRLPLRRQEIGGLQHDEIDLEEGTLRISAKRAKNHLEHTLPMPRQVVELLRTVPNNGRAAIFGQRGESGFTSWSSMKDELDGRLTGVRPFHLHDLRRTLTSRFAKMGVPMVVSEAILNHREEGRGGLREVYDQHDYADEIADALQRWSDLLDTMLAGKKAPVVKLTRKAS